MMINGYVIVDREGEPFTCSLKDTKKEAIAAFTDKTNPASLFYNEGMDWKHWYRRGYRAKKVLDGKIQ
jgi:hypothetical protein